MREIKKHRPPSSLTAFIKGFDASYENLSQNVREDIKNSLLIEQGFLCAYCMRRISFAQMRIEHWACQEVNPDLQLDYANLLACCQGNEGQGSNKETCDVKKKNHPIKYSPANPSHQLNKKVTYFEHGKIRSQDPEFNQDLETVLNLNENRLVRNRNAALEAIQDLLRRKQGTCTKAQLQALLGKVMAVNNCNERKEYYGFLAYYLENKIK